MISYCLKSRKNTECKSPKAVTIKNRRTILSSKCSVFNWKKMKFLKEQKARRLLSKLKRVKVLILSDFLSVNTLY